MTVTSWPPGHCCRWGNGPLAIGIAPGSGELCEGTRAAESLRLRGRGPADSIHCLPRTVGTPKTTKLWYFRHSNARGTQQCHTDCCPTRCMYTNRKVRSAAGTTGETTFTAKNKSLASVEFVATTRTARTQREPITQRGRWRVSPLLSDLTVDPKPRESLLSESFQPNCWLITTFPLVPETAF